MDKLFERLDRAEKAIAQVKNTSKRNGTYVKWLPQLTLLSQRQIWKV
jgi:hypothetical protein